MNEFGVREFLLWIAISTGLTGFQLGMPPRDEDRVLSRIAPAECVYYARHSGCRNPNPDATNLAERVQANPEVQRFVDGIQAILADRLKWAETTSEEFHPKGTDDRTAMVRLLFRQPAAWYISNLKIANQGDLEGFHVGKYVVVLDGAVVVNLEESAPKLPAFIEALLLGFLEDAGEVESAASGFKKIAFADSRIEWWFIQEGNYFAIATSEHELRGVIDRMSSEPPEWLLAAEKDHSYQQRSTLAYFRLDRLLEACRLLLPIPLNPQGSGLESWKQCVLSSGLQDEDAVSRVEWICKPGAEEHSHLEERGISLKSFSSIPEDAMLAAVIHFDPKRAHDFVSQVMPLLSPSLWSSFQQMEAQTSQQAGFTWTDILMSFDGQWKISASRGEGGVITGWIVEAGIGDRAKLDKNLAGIKRLASQITTARGSSVQSHVINGHNVTTFKAHGFVAEPSWCVDDETLLISLYPQAMSARISATSANPPLAVRPEISELLAKSVSTPSNTLCFVCYLDMPSIAEWLLPLAQFQISRSLGEPNEVRNQGVDHPELAMPILPSARAIFPQRKPSLWTVNATDRGLTFYMRSPLPVDNLGAAIPLAVAIGLPAARMAHDRHEKALSIQKMRQLLLAILNFENATRRYPTCIVDKNQKPLLSWRVNLLPYLGEQKLYSEFNLDEAWDSPHNRKLIARIPKILQAPGSNAEAGKTNYLGIAHAEGVFALPEVNQPSTRIRDIKDGLSHTIAIVEVADELAAIWTKPDDFVPDSKAPSRGLTGLRTDHFLAGFCDGHVQPLPISIDDKNLNALYTMDGGEVVTLPENNLTP